MDAAHHTAERAIGSGSKARAEVYPVRRIWGGIRRTLGDVSCLNHRLLEGPFLTDEGVWQSREAGSSPGSQSGRGEKPRHNAAEGP